MPKQRFAATGCARGEGASDPQPRRGLRKISHGIDANASEVFCINVFVLPLSTIEQPTVFLRGAVPLFARFLPQLLGTPSAWPRPTRRRFSRPRLLPPSPLFLVHDFPCCLLWKRRCFCLLRGALSCFCVVQIHAALVNSPYSNIITVDITVEDGSVSVVVSNATPSRRLLSHQLIHSRYTSSPAGTPGRAGGNLGGN